MLFRRRPRNAMLWVAVTSVLLASPVIAQDSKIKAQTFVYKTVGELEIKADVHRSDDELVRPVVVWIHGGALINGHRAGISGRVKREMLAKGYVLVSIDYRLAPETKMPAIIEDLEDAFKWLRRDGPKLFHADVSKVAVMGGSAGGYLTLVAGHRIQPRPTVLVAFWGYGDLLGDWYTKPSPHPRHRRPKMTRKEAFAEVNGPAVSDSRDRKGNGGAFYQYCRQQGIWPSAVTNWDPVRDVKKFTPYLPVKNVSPEYPPTLMIHGTEDTDVPHQESVMMAEQFKRHGVAHKLISIAGGEHGLAGGDPKQIDEAYQAAFEFTLQRMK